MVQIFGPIPYNQSTEGIVDYINPLNAELNPICHLLALLGAHHILHVSRIRVKGQIYFPIFGLIMI